MKKIAGKIAMILILVILASSFISCFSITAISNGDPIWLILTIPLDVATMIFQLCGLALGMDLWDGDLDPFSDASGEMETQIYLANAKDNPSAEYYSAMEIFNSLPQTEKVTLMEKINSLPETKLAGLVSTVASLPQAEIAASMERLNALSEAELVSAVQDFNALSEAEFDILVEKINSKVKTENVVLADDFIKFPEPNIVSLKNDLQYFNMGIRLCFQY